jgi:hypothetical protein
MLKFSLYIVMGACLGYVGFFMVFKSTADLQRSASPLADGLVTVAAPHQGEISKTAFVHFVSSITKELFGTVTDGSSAARSSTQMIELASRVDRGENTASVFITGKEHEQTHEAAFASGAVWAALVYWNAGQSTQLAEVGEISDLSAFMWGGASALRVKQEDVRNDYVTKVLLHNPVASAGAILPVAVLYEHEALKMIVDTAVIEENTIPDQLYPLFRELLQKNPRFAARALLRLPPNVVHSLLRAEPEKWADLGAAYLEPLLNPSNHDLYQCPPHVIGALQVHHPRSAARWAATHWGSLSRSQRIPFWSALQGSPELARELLNQNFGSDEKSWLDIRKYLCAALVESDMKAFVNYVGKLPQNDQEKLWDETLMTANRPELVLEFGKTHTVSQEVLNHITDHMAAFAPEKLADFVAKLPPEAQPEAIGRAAGSHLAMGRVEEGLALARELLTKPDLLEDASSRKDLINVVAHGLVTVTGDTALGAKWIEQLPDPDVRARCAIEFGREWSWQEPYEAAKYLLNQPRSEERDVYLRKAAADIPDTSQREEIFRSLHHEPSNAR